MVPAVLAFPSVSLVPAILIFQGLKISTDGSDSSSSQRHLNFSGWIFVIYVECCYIVNLLTIIWITLTQGLNTQKIVVEFQSSIVLTCIQLWKARYVSPFFEHGLPDCIFTNHCSPGIQSSAVESKGGWQLQPGASCVICLYNHCIHSSSLGCSKILILNNLSSNFSRILFKLNWKRASV